MAATDAHAEEGGEIWRLFEESEAGASEEEPEWTPLGLGGAAAGIELQLARATVWGSSMRMAQWLLAHPELVAQRRVIELGAGVGLPSLVAAAVGATSAVATDVDESGLEALAAAIAHNGPAVANAQPMRLDWFAFLRSERCGAPLSPAPVLLAADVNYESAAVPALVATVSALLAPGGALLLASREERIGLSAMVRELCATIGLR